MILLIDNYDSFVYNLARYFVELGQGVLVKRNDAISLTDIAQLKPSHIVISPGPCTPNEAGISLAAIKEFGHKLPILGVCLGHQAIGQVYGGNVVKAAQPMHGKRSLVKHEGKNIFAGLPNPLPVGRYHSLMVAKETLPAELEVSALSEVDEIMGLSHRHYPVFGVQFHPESVLTEYGYQLLENFLSVRAID